MLFELFFNNKNIKLDLSILRNAIDLQWDYAYDKILNDERKRLDLNKENLETVIFTVDRFANYLEKMRLGRNYFKDGHADGFVYSHLSIFSEQLKASVGKLCVVYKKYGFELVTLKDAATGENVLQKILKKFVPDYDPSYLQAWLKRERIMIALLECFPTLHDSLTDPEKKILEQLRDMSKG